MNEGRVEREEWSERTSRRRVPEKISKRMVTRELPVSPASCQRWHAAGEALGKNNGTHFMEDMEGTMER